MKYYFICLFLILMLTASLVQYADCKIITSGGYKNYLTTTKNQINDYNTELKDVEIFLFRRIFYNETTLSRISRIEKYLFKRTYATLSIDDRMDSILKTYDNPRYYDKKKNLYSSFVRNFVGVPTGMTPSIGPIFPFRYNNGFYSNSSIFGNNHTSYRYYY